MIRYIWLLVTLIGWAVIFFVQPSLPPIIYLISFGVSAAAYVYGWVLPKRNWLIHFFTAILWIGIWSAAQGMALYEKLIDQIPVHVQPIIIGKTLMILTLIASGFLTFVNYRISLNFVQRRGNIDRDMLGRLYENSNPWRKLLRRIKQKKGLLIQLGEEVPFD